MTAANQLTPPPGASARGVVQGCGKRIYLKLFIGWRKIIICKLNNLFELILSYPLYHRQNNGFTPTPRFPIVLPPLPTLLHRAACFWLVVVCKIIDQHPSKAWVYYIYIFLLFKSPPKQWYHVSPERPLLVAPPLHTPLHCGHLFLVGCCVEIDWSAAV